MAVRPPRISVLMAVHNARRYLERGLRSVLRQTFPDFEFIIVDDGSTDGSRRLLERWARRDARIRLISRENRGLTRSLNEALSLARGEFVARMDADDVSLPTRFALQLDYLARHPEYVAVGGEVLLVDPEGWPIGFRGHPRAHDDIDRWLLQANGGALTHPAVMMRASALREIGGYREKFPVAQDLDLFLRLAETGRLANLPEILLQWRQSRHSVNATKHHAWRDMKRMALEDAMARRRIQLDVGAVLSADRRPSGTPRLAWAGYALKAGHPWTALKNGVLSYFSEECRPEASALLAETLAYLYWQEFRNKLSRRRVRSFWG